MPQRRNSETERQHFIGHTVYLYLWLTALENNNNEWLKKNKAYSCVSTPVMDMCNA